MHGQACALRVIQNWVRFLVAFCFLLVCCVSCLFGVAGHGVWLCFSDPLVSYFCFWLEHHNFCLSACFSGIPLPPTVTCSVTPWCPGDVGLSITPSYNLWAYVCCLVMQRNTASFWLLLLFVMVWCHVWVFGCRLFLVASLLVCCGRFLLGLFGIALSCLWCVGILVVCRTAEGFPYVIGTVRSHIPCCIMTWCLLPAAALGFTLVTDVCFALPGCVSIIPFVSSV